jgi:tetratricopeptide (TPR) repeat protein
MIGGLSAAAVLVILALPYAISAYYLQAGGRALERALGRHDALEWWYVGPREVRDPRALAVAIAHLEKAKRAPYARRLLGQAYVARGDNLSGVLALEQFVERRPEQYLAQLELAAAYLYADERLGELETLDLLDHLNGAAISAPSLDGETRFSAKEWQSEYVYPTTYSLPPEYGDRPTLFLHAGSQVTWTVTLSETGALSAPSVLRFGMGQAPHSLDWGGDGATFEVFVDGARVFLEHLPVEQAREGWHEREVDLSQYAGQTVQLSLATTPGPTGDVTGDWAGWGEPRLEEVDASAYRELVKRQPWRAKWNEMGVQAEDWIEAGEVAREDRAYETALAWYEWAERLSSKRGDGWYYRGLVRYDREDWPGALDAFARAVELGRFEYAPASSPHYYAGAIYQRRLSEPQIEAALAEYERALKLDDFESAWQRADAHHKRAEILWSQKAYAEAIAGFRQAIEIYPGHSGAHLLLGVALYESEKDLAAAEAALLAAQKLSPKGKWSYYQLGRIYEQEGQQERAEQMYERAVELDPGFAEAARRLEALHAD